MSRADKFQVPWQETCWRCDAAAFNFQCTDELAPLDRFIGQDRAQEAIRFGLEVDKPGYNLFVTGLTGTGKTSAIRTHLSAVIDDMERRNIFKPISDWVYVYNFDDPDRPRAIRLPPGTSKALRYRMSEVLRVLGAEIPKVFKSEEYETRRRGVEEADRQETRNLMAQLEQAAQAANFAVQVSASGVTIFPLLDNRPMTPDEFQALGPDETRVVDDTRNLLMQRTQDVMAKIKDVEKSSSDKVRDLERDVANQRVGGLFQVLAERYQDRPQVKEYLDRLAEYVLDNLSLIPS